MRGVLLSVIVVGVLLGGNCSNEPITAERGGGGEITGKVLTPDCKPALHAEVKLIDFFNKDSVCAALSDSQGEYLFKNDIILGDEKEYGLYNICGTKDSLRFFDTAIVIFRDGFIRRTDTLKSTGKLYCIARLEDKSDHSGISVSIAGISIFGQTDSSGGIMLLQVPKGTHRICFQKNGYNEQYRTKLLNPEKIDTVGPVFLSSDDEVVPVPVNCSLSFDTTTGIINFSWESTNEAIGEYEIHIFDSTIDKFRKDGKYITVLHTGYAEMPFTELTPDSIMKKHIAFQVRSNNDDNNPSRWSDFCTLTVDRPVVPPIPHCSLSVIDKGRVIAVHNKTAKLWWVDSLYVYRSTITDGDYGFIGSCGAEPSGVWYDTLDNIPATSDSVVDVYYMVKTRSRYGCFSDEPQILLTSLNNPYWLYTLPAPEKPVGPPPEADAGTYVFRFEAVNSPIENDTVYYRLRINDTHSGTQEITAWYPGTWIEITLADSGVHIIQCQASSRLMKGLESSWSDSQMITIRPSHTVRKPPTPQGREVAFVDTSYTVISDYRDSCNLQHSVEIRYVATYQGTIITDPAGTAGPVTISTDWYALPENRGTFFWEVPGVVCIAAQTRCTKDSTVVSSWSDALVVTVLERDGK